MGVVQVWLKVKENFKVRITWRTEPMADGAAVRRV